MRELDISLWNVSKVRILSHCFEGCTKLTILDLALWNTSRVETIEYCFARCTSLVYLNVENWVINERCNTKDMFNECDNLSLIKCRQDTFEKIKGSLKGVWEYENGFATKISTINGE